jgi:DNA-binding Lrp family transcriptional regulator
MKTTKIVKLNEADTRLLAVIEHRAAAPFSSIARLVRSKEHSTRYRFHALRRRGVILERVPFVDMYRLGYVVFKIYCQIASEKQSVQQKLISYLTKSAHVLWVAQVGGPYQLVFSVCIRKITEINPFLEKLTEAVGIVFNQTDLVIQLRFTAFGRKYLAPTLKGAPALRFGFSDKESVSTDVIDNTILTAVCRGDLTSERNLGEQVKIPLTTLRRRLKNLENEGVIAGYIYRYNLAAIGLNRFTFLLSVRGLSSSISEKMHLFCSRHERIVNLSECIGAWQFEITVDVESAADTVAILRDIGDTFGALVSQVTTIPVFKSFKYSSYPGLLSE